MMDEKTKELIAVGVSAGVHCQPCLDFHVNKARELGIAAEMIAEAIEVGFMVEKGALAAMKKYVDQVMSTPQAAAGPCCSGGKSSCCG